MVGGGENYPPRPYPKSHIAKNAIPAPFIYYLVRLWLMVYEDEQRNLRGSSGLLQLR